MSASARSCLPGLLLVCLTMTTGEAWSDNGDKRLREITYDPHTVVSVPVLRGTVTLILLDRDETIEEVATGLGADCNQAEAAWCIAAQVGGRSLFVKPKSGASAPNNLTVVTDRRSHSFRLAIVDDHGTTPPVYRLTVHAPAAHDTHAADAQPGARPSLLSALDALAEPVLPASDVVAERLQAAPRVVNAAYSLAEGTASADIVPTLVFDDGRFTYLRFPGNRPVPAVFDVLGDDSETVVNTRMEGELLVVDLVSRRLVLRAGAAVVGIWNDAFDLDGTPPTEGTTVPGVRRLIRGADAGPPSAAGGMP